MKYTWYRDSGVFEAGGDTYKVTSVVRNELDGSRRLHDGKEVVTSTPREGNPERFPVMPRPFPKGLWHFTKIYPTRLYEYKPVIFETDAFQWLCTWRLDEKGGYEREDKDSMVKDYGYWLHCAWYKKDGVWRRSGTTHGCGNIDSEADASELATLIKAGDELEVV